MPVGVQAETLQNVPVQPYITDPAAFFERTKRRIYVPHTFAAPGGGASVTRELPKAGVWAKMLVTFVGEMTVATGEVTPTDEWPYNLLAAFTTNVNGHNELVNVTGADLHCLRYVRYPAYEERTDVFPGQVGGGTAVAVDTHPLHLTWEIPFAIDDVTLIGSLFAQSDASSIQYRIVQARNDDLVTANPGNVTITGDFSIEGITYEVPFDGEGNIIVPHLEQLHGINGLSTSITNTGENRVSLIRSAGQLARLFISARRNVNNLLSAHPSAAAADRLRALSLEYGARHRPFVFDPASSLASINNHHYGRVVPYRRLVLDQIKEHPQRDAIYMQGLTELAVVLDIPSTVTLTAGSARLVQETLFSA